MSEEENQLIEERKNKLQELRDQGTEPYPYSFNKTHDAAQLQRSYASLEAQDTAEEEVSIAGRLMNIRVMGKATFMHIQDETDKVQLYLRQDDLGEESYKLLKKIDIGDFIGASGTIFKTKKGETTVHVQQYQLLSKSLRPLPEKYHGLKDKETRFRNRHLDLIMNHEIRDLFKKRSAMIKTIRDLLHEKGFIEVETPLLQTQYGGASACPFKTHVNAWNMDIYLSISPELYLKRLIIGGYEKIFTICKNFRNEGVDHSHNPEFSMLELYQAYTDYSTMMQIVEEAFEKAALTINGTTKVTHNVDGEEYELDFKAPWRRLSMREAIQEYCGIDIEEHARDDLASFCERNNIEYESQANWGDLVLLVFDEMVEHRIIQPTHVYDHPKEGTPLCKRHRENPRYNEQCEPIALGMEIANMYSELNDPDMQLQQFREQEEKGRGGDEEAHPMDTDFLRALQVGMPPTGGVGWGIDRMVILLTGMEGIRDVILFPTMKPKEEE